MVQFMRSYGLILVGIALFAGALAGCGTSPSPTNTATPQAFPTTLTPPVTPAFWAGGATPAAATPRPASTMPIGTIPPSPSVAPGATQASPTTALPPEDALSTPKQYDFVPDSPLPAPAPVSSGPEEERAAVLAQQVLAGGEGALPALVAAIQQAGFPIRDASGRVLVQPVGRSQGIAFEQWEVNALAELVANRRQVTVPLDNFAETLASPLAELQGAPMVALLLDGVRDHARDKDGPMLFWAVFIVELGLQDPTHEPYDLLFQVDPAQAQLDTLQMVFITKRLAADVAALAHPDEVSPKQTFHLPSWPVKKAYAAELPCTLDDTTAEILDWVAVASGFGFDQLLGYLADHGMKGAERYSVAASFANVVLAYGKLAAVQAAFDMEIEMQGGTPLVRTQEMQPETGEKRTLVAKVKMDYGNWQLANCFRIMLNAAGLDFDTEFNDGPVKDASVAWSGGTGFGGAIVQYVGDAGGRIQTGTGGPTRILNGRTDADGRATVDVEGVGQRRRLGDNPRPVMKEATAIAMAVLKPANMYRDFKDAISTAMSGLAGLLTVPAEMMYRTHWSFGGQYTFPVKDWKPGNDVWTGTITDTMWKRQMLEDTRESVCCGGRPVIGSQTDRLIETVQQSWEIMPNADAEELTPEFAMATASYSVSGGYGFESTYRRTGWNSCKGGPEATWSKNTVTEEAGASLTGEAEVTINIDEDGSYSIGAGTAAGVAHGDRYYKSELEYGPSCGASTPTQTVKKTLSYSPHVSVPMIEGKVDSNNPDKLAGTKTVVEKDPKVGITITHTYTWDLRR